MIKNSQVPEKGSCIPHHSKMKMKRKSSSGGVSSDRDEHSLSALKLCLEMMDGLRKEDFHKRIFKNISN